MKYIKLFEDFDNQENFKETTEKLDSYDQQIVESGFRTFKRFVETDNFIYFSDGEEGVVMYNKDTLELVSDNYMAFDDLYDVFLNGSFTWLSDDAKEQLELMRDT